MHLSLPYLLILLCIAVSSALLILALKKVLAFNREDTKLLLICTLGIILITRPLALWAHTQLLTLLYHNSTNTYLLPASFSPFLYWILLLGTLLFDTLLIIWAMRYSIKQSIKISAVIQAGSLIGALTFALLR